MVDWVSFFSAPASLFMVGLLGAGHCVGMCGGITAALGFAGHNLRPKASLLFSYNAGRITSYTIAGALVGGLGFLGESYLALGKPLRGMAGVLLVLMGFYVMGRAILLPKLEKVGSHLWQHVQPLGRRFLPVKSPAEGFMLGVLWGWLPCGLVYTALAFSATSAAPVEGALAMLAFGCGTLPAMLAGGYFSQQLKELLQRRPLRSVMGVLLVLFGSWTLWAAVSPHHQHHQHTSSNEGVEAGHGDHSGHFGAGKHEY